MSTNISDRMSKEIQNEVAVLLGRGRTTFECPLSVEERVELWHNMTDPEILRAHLVLQVAGYNTNYHTFHEGKFTTVLEGESYEILFHQRDGTRDHSLLIDNRSDKYRDSATIAAAFPRPIEDWPEFVQWVQNTGRIEHEFSAALATLEELMGFCNTIGQLTRAVPELAQYMSREKREILQGQKRASNMPFEWATFERSRIDVLQFSLAKAHLMPKASRSASWHEISGSRACLQVTA